MLDKGGIKINWLGSFSDTETPLLVGDLPINQLVEHFIDYLFITDENGELLGYFANKLDFQPQKTNIHQIIALRHAPSFDLKTCCEQDVSLNFRWLDHARSQLKAKVYPVHLNDQYCFAWAGVEFILDEEVKQSSDANSLDQYEKMLKSFLVTSTEGFILTDESFNIQKTNEALLEILNLNDQQCIGLPLLTVLCLKKGKDCTEHLSQVVATGIPVNFPEEKIETSKGTVYVSLTFLKVEERIGVIVRDITETKTKEKELIKARFEAEKSAKIKETFLTNISHELRTPLNAIVGMTEMLQQTDTNPKQKKFLDVIAQSGDSLKSIIDDILDVTQIGAENFGLEQKPFRIWDVVEIVQNFTYIKISEKDINIEYKVTGIRDDLYIIGDSTRLAQVIKNLVGNAFKFTEKGTVRVSIKNLHETDDKITIHFEVLDTGIGISEEHQKLIFTLFSQRELGISRQYGGVGLGLYLTNRLVDKCGGVLKLDSQLGFGSIFHFDLTFDKTNLATEDSNLNFSGLNTLKNKRILLVEDQEFNQFLVTSNERKWDCTIDVAPNGKVAIEMLASSHYDIVLMDILMPIMGGEEASHYIRNQMPKPICDIPIIALTANALKGDREKYIQLGMNDYLSKPFKPSQLLSVLLRTLNANSTVSAEQEEEMKRTEQARHKKNEPNYDLSEIISLSNGNKDFVHKMLSIFVQSAYLSIDEVNKLNEEHQFRDVAKAIHKIKSPSKLLKIHDLVSIILEIETKISEGCTKDDLNSLINSYSIILAGAANSLSNELKAYT